MELKLIFYGVIGMSFDSMKSGNADWEENGKAMQAKFDEISTCISPDYYDSYELYNNPNT